MSKAAENENGPGHNALRRSGSSPRDAFRWAPVAIGLAAITAAVAPGCGSGATGEAPERSVAQAIVGGLADPVISTAGRIVNRYSALAADAAAGATTLTVLDAAGLAAAPGDLLMVIQMQGASVDATNTAAYGSITGLGSAGAFEMVTVSSVTGNKITLAAGCGLRNAYAAAAHTQVVWVPQYKALTVTATGSIAAPPWNGSTGGVVAIDAQTATIAGTIDVSGTGFRGGALTNFANNPVTAGFQYRSVDPNDGAEKGESIAGYETEYDTLGGRYSLGAVANGGGGGAAHNGGGGGGANGDDGNAWTGAGVMPATVTGAAAWSLDDADKAAGGLTASSGGGRGGYSYSQAAEDPTVVAPGNPLWNGDRRQYRGGLGGRPLADDAVARVFLGGGGGAGNENNNAGGAGGSGGGIVYIVAGTLSGTGTVRADGSAGADTAVGPNTGNDGPGGGGGGGSIVVVAPSAATLTFSANGGAGGRQFIAGHGTEAEGPGGGGGGGFIALPGAAPTTIAGGAGGTTDSTAVLKFPRNGATDGAPGRLVKLGAGVQPPMCIAADLGVTIAQSGGTPTAGTSVAYTIVATNHGPNPVSGATVQDTFGAAFSGDTWTCAGAACPAAAGTGNLAATLGALGSGATVTFTVVANIAPTATSPLTNTVTVVPPPGVTDGVPADDSATASSPLDGATASLALTLTHSPAAVVVGGPFSSTLTVTNAGPSVATGLSATVTAPAGSTLGTITAPGWACAAPVGLAVTCTAATLANGASASITVAATAPAAPAALSASASLSATVSDPAPKTATDPINVVCNADGQCASTQWCSGAGLCLPRLVNGVPLSPDAPIAGLCSAVNASRVCLTGVCDARGNVCGIQLGDGVCTSSTQCIAGLCDPVTQTCLLPMDAGPADAGSDAAGPDGGVDASAIDAASEGGGNDTGAPDAAADGAPGDGSPDGGIDGAANDGGRDGATNDGGAGDGGMGEGAAADGAANDGGSASDADAGVTDGAANDGAAADGAANDGALDDSATDAGADGSSPTESGDAGADSSGDAGDGATDGDGATTPDASGETDDGSPDAGAPGAAVDNGTIEGGGLSCAVGGGPGRSGAPGGWIALAAAVLAAGTQRRRRARRA